MLERDKRSPEDVRRSSDGGDATEALGEFTGAAVMSEKEGGRAVPSCGEQVAVYALQGRQGGV